MNIQEMVDKAWQGKSWEEIADAPVDALRGVSPGDADKLKAAFNIDTVRDFAMLKFVRWAQEIVERADSEDPIAITITDSFARSVVESHYYNYWTAQYNAHQNDIDLDEPFLGSFELDRRNLKQAPLSVQEAHNYYFETVEQADWGGVSYYQVPINMADQVGPSFFLVRTTTDGDDGWVELYDQAGIELGVGRTYIELIGWGDRDEIRGMVNNGEFPDELENRQEDTLWGK